MKLLIAALFLMISSSVLAQKLQIKIIDRQDHDTDYSYVVPGYFSSNSNATVDCSASDYSANCTGHG